MAFLFRLIIVVVLWVSRIADAARDCSELWGQGIHTDGVYNVTVQINGADKAVTVYCEFRDDGGWMRFQRREDGSTDFYRYWSDYKQGFGNIAAEHWLGNENIHYLTNQVSYVLRVDLKLWDGRSFYAEYSQFNISNELDQYRLHVSGYSGTAGDSLWQTPSPGEGHNNRQFSTRDKDNDESGANCAVSTQSAWWFSACFYSHLNGIYFKDGVCPHGAKSYECIQWRTLADYIPYRKTTMLIKDPSVPPPTTPITTPAATTVAVKTTAMTSSPTPVPVPLSDPTVEIRLEGIFRSLDNQTLPSPCVYDYNIQLENKAKSTVEDVNLEMTSICSESSVLVTYKGIQINAVGSEASVTFTFNVIGQKHITAQSLETCSNAITSNMQPHSNWDQPLIADVVGCPSVSFDQDYFNVLYLGWACEGA